MVQQEYWAEMSRSFEVWEHIHVGMELSTVSLRGIEASDDRAVAGAINIASLVHGTVAYGDKEQRDGFPSTRGGRREPLQDAVGDSRSPCGGRSLGPPSQGRSRARSSKCKLSRKLSRKHDDLGVSRGRGGD
jgi:hypothetical protein